RLRHSDKACGFSSRHLALSAAKFITSSTETGNAGNLALPASPYPGMAGTMIAGAPVTPRQPP
ncbi:hypothetical protein, partial [Burkholderia ubonensis]|uniref:hypothetical protein n=1 Tax=Burkholderia ubonensis TaxID=101571 RepID=UPI0012F72176